MVLKRVIAYIYYKKWRGYSTPQSSPALAAMIEKCKKFAGSNSFAMILSIYSVSSIDMWLLLPQLTHLLFK